VSRLPAAHQSSHAAPPDPPLATYDPDFLKNYELGFKTTWLNNHLRVNGASSGDWKNFQSGSWPELLHDRAQRGRRASREPTGDRMGGHPGLHAHRRPPTRPKMTRTSASTPTRDRRAFPLSTCPRGTRCPRHAAATWPSSREYHGALHFPARQWRYATCRVPTLPDSSNSDSRRPQRADRRQPAYGYSCTAGLRAKFNA